MHSTRLQEIVMCLIEMCIWGQKERRKENVDARIATKRKGAYKGDAFLIFRSLRREVE